MDLQHLIYQQRKVSDDTSQLSDCAIIGFTFPCWVSHWQLASYHKWVDFPVSLIKLLEKFWFLLGIWIKSFKLLVDFSYIIFLMCENAKSSSH